MESRKRHSEKLQHNQRGLEEMVNKNSDYSRCISDSSFPVNSSWAANGGLSRDRFV
jgi:hypothetical protein